ncbi:MAG: M1 family aminopeptidase [Pseudomonadota bacterium]
MKKMWLLVICFALAQAAGCDDGGGNGDEDATDTVDALDDSADMQADDAPADMDAPDEAPVDAADDTPEDMVPEDVVSEEDAPEGPHFAFAGGDIISTSLLIDLEALEATATISVEAPGTGEVFFEAGGLVISEVRDSGGTTGYTVSNGLLHVTVTPDSVVELEIDYEFSVQAQFEGLMDGGMTLTWPYYCGNLFPCHSEPADGSLFDLEIINAPEDQVTVYPETIPTEAPAYQLAWATDNFEYIELGTTDAGTEIGVWHTPSGTEEALSGTDTLVAVFDWYEKSVGPFPFGGRAGVVEVDWGYGAIGGMEHLPFWHVSASGMSDDSIHAHEAAHGWFGDGVRIACWEDFVLSEGTATYLTARATELAVGADDGAAIWAGYASELNFIVTSRDGIAWPDSCGVVDIIDDGLFSRVPYIKGAYFYRAVADEIGAEELDSVLSLFFEAHVGGYAGMQDMLDLIEAETGFDPTDLADGWLRSLGRPD